jgi:hypothetical protein
VALWSYAEGNSTALAIVVVVVAASAVFYVARRLWSASAASLPVERRLKRGRR